MISSRNFAPSAKLLPFLRRHYLVSANLPDELEFEDLLMADNAFVRVLLRGDWAWWNGSVWENLHGPLLFGANSRALKVRVRGPFSVAAFSFRPSAWTSLVDSPATQFADRIVPLNEAWDPAIVEALMLAASDAPNDEACVERMEAVIERQLGHVGRNRVDPVVASFESIARSDSTIKVEAAAKLLGLSPRQLERRCLASFGLSPKAVLQRCRFLDMAAAMRGLSHADEAELAALRFFDQSHLNREFRRYTGMTPGAFQRLQSPLFTASLDLRESGKTLA